MCGVIAVLRRKSGRTVPDATELIAGLDRALGALASGVAGLEEAAATVAEVDRALRGAPGAALLVGDPEVAAAINTAVAGLDAVLAGLEAALDDGTADLGDRDLEEVNAALIACKDATWAVGRDRLRTAAAVADLLAGPQVADGTAERAAVDAYLSIQLALSALDRLEVRGRDSAGIHVLVSGHGLDLTDPEVQAAVHRRSSDRLFMSGAIRVVGDRLSFVYKAAAEIGELGDNVAALRTAIRVDDLLRRAVSVPTAEAAVLGHTRWASVGIISQANAHPLNSEEADGPVRPYVTAALNGDVDNYVSLREEAGLSIPAEVTTDAKIIPALVARRLEEGLDAEEAFRRTVAAFEGSVAVGAQVAGRADQLFLALHGSGQALYVGLAEDAFLVASEPYGLVEETSRYLRLDGEGTGGQVVVLERTDAGTVEGIRRLAYDGTELPVASDELTVAEITTRDIDRGGFPHFLLKEITEAPLSFRKTLRGRIVERDGVLRVDLGPAAVTPAIAERLASGSIRRILVIGQGTAAVAAKSVASAIQRSLGGRGPIVASGLATELSGFDLQDDMSDLLVVAVSQSGTTTDTNRTVDLVRGRGAVVIAIVNRRNSDLVDKSDGVIYNSDGRDVEMAVPSTKAFYAQIAAGFLLAIVIAETIGVSDPAATHDLVGALRGLPDAMAEVLARRPTIAEAARLAPPRRYWAVVGNGANRVAAEEVRIKLSELCYKSIACDGTEDKKHIDLSSEPLILVCAAGLEGPTAADVAKEVAIYRAHKAAPVIIATDGEDRFAGTAMAVISVPRVHRSVGFVLSAMAGHLFGYEAALSIDAQARPLRAARAAIDAAVEVGGDDLLERISSRLAELTEPFQSGLAAGQYDGHLEASAAVRLTSLLRYATGQLPLEDYEQHTGKLGTPTALIEDVIAALSTAIDQLTRPIDAIKHQAKTVTVGISRSEDALLRVPLVAEVLATGAHRSQLAYRTLRTVAALDPAVAEVTGYTRYQIEGPAIHVVDRGGSAAGLRSRTDADPILRGTKRRAAETREVIVAVGRSDGRTVMILPEIKGNQVIGIDLVHVRLVDRLAPAAARSVLEGYGPSRYSAIVDAVTETVPVFDDLLLGSVDVVELLTQPVYNLADRWKS
jgi:glucosamine--fructose-6-phosphate aminotransferase (isomerizing)